MSRLRSGRVLLLFLVTSSTVKALIGSVEPTSAVIEAGSNIVLNCSLNISSNGGRTAHDVVWLHYTNPLPQDSFIAVSNMLSQLSLTNVTFSNSGFYYCVFPGDGLFERKVSSVDVGIKPEPPLVEYVIPNPEKYWCCWNETTPTNLRTHFNFTFWFNGQWTPCPDHSNVDTPCPDHSKGDNACLIPIDWNTGTTQTCQVVSSNKLGSAFARTSFNPFTDIVVNPPQRVIVIKLEDKTALRVEWNLPAEWRIDLPHLDYKLRYAETDCIMTNETCCCWEVVTLINFQSNEYVLSNLHPYTNYKAQLAARYGLEEKNWSKWSAEGSARTRQILPSGAVRNLKIKNDSHQNPLLRNVRVFWEAPDRTLLNGELLGYTITVKRQDQLDVRQIMTSPYMAWFRIEGLEKFYGYNIRVAAVNAAGEGPASEVQLYDLTATPNPPDEVTAVAKTTTSILVKWKTPNEPNGFIQFYQVEWGRSNKNKYALNRIKTFVASPNQSYLKGITLKVVPMQLEPNGFIQFYQVEWGRSNKNKFFRNTPNTTFLLEGLESFVLYDIGVRTRNTRGFSGLQSVSARTLEGVPDVAPTNLKAKPIENFPNQLALMWSHLPADNMNGNITGYRISFCEGASYTEVVTRTCAGGQPLTKNMTNPSVNSDTLTGLKPSTMYSVWIAAYTGVGRGPESQPVLGTTAAEPKRTLLRNIFIPVGVVILLVFVMVAIGIKCRGVLQPFPGPKYASSIDIFKNGSHNWSRSSSRIEGEHFDDILPSPHGIESRPVDVKSCEVGEEALQTVIKDPKFMRSESRDSGVPPSPAGDLPDFGALREKRGSSSDEDGDDTVFLEDEESSRNKPKKLRVQIDSVNRAHEQSQGAGLPSSPTDTVGPYTLMGQIAPPNFPSRPSTSSPVKSPKKVSFEIPQGNNGAVPGPKKSSQMQQQKPPCGSRTGSVSSPTDVSPYTMMSALETLPCPAPEGQNARQTPPRAVVSVPSTMSSVSPYTHLSALASLQAKQVNAHFQEQPSADAWESPTSPPVSLYTKMSKKTSPRCNQQGPSATSASRNLDPATKIPQHDEASICPNPGNSVLSYTQMSDVASLQSKQAKAPQQDGASSCPNPGNSPVSSYTRMSDVASLQSKQAKAPQQDGASDCPSVANTTVLPYTTMLDVASLQSKQAKTDQSESPTGASTTPDSPYTQMPVLGSSQSKQVKAHDSSANPLKPFVCPSIQMSSKDSMQIHQQKPNKKFPRSSNPSCSPIPPYIQTASSKSGMPRELNSTRRSGCPKADNPAVSSYIPLSEVEELEPRKSQTAQPDSPVEFTKVTPTEVSQTNLGAQEDDQEDASIPSDNDPYVALNVDPTKVPSTALHPPEPGPSPGIQGSPKTEFEFKDESHCFTQMPTATSSMPPLRSNQVSDLTSTLAVTDYTQIGSTDNPLSGSISSYEDSTSSCEDAHMSSANENSSSDAESFTSQPGSEQATSQDHLESISVDMDSGLSDNDHDSDVSQEPSLSSYVQIAEPGAPTGQNGIIFPQRNLTEAGVGVPVLQEVSDYVLAGSWPSHNANRLM